MSLDIDLDKISTVLENIKSQVNKDNENFENSIDELISNSKDITTTFSELKDLLSIEESSKLNIDEGLDELNSLLIQLKEQYNQLNN